jgi:hypothetical protein
MNLPPSLVEPMRTGLMVDLPFRGAAAKAADSHPSTLR